MTDTALKPVLAYQGDHGLKESTMAQIAMHKAADEIIGGAYYEKHGEKLQVCGVGCIMHDAPGIHRAMSEQYGFPLQLVHLYEGIFEAFTRGEENQKNWPERFMGAIEPGADLSRVWPSFAAWLMLDEKWGMVALPDLHEDVEAICRRVGEAYQRMAAGEQISDEEQQDIARAARAARDAWAARDARDARAARAARDARDARAARAARAARDARDARDARAARAARAARDARDARAAWDAWDAWAAWDARAARDARDARAARDAWAAWDARAARDAKYQEYVAASSFALVEILRAATPEPVLA
jgi:hypothetical protein